jgi:ankyrin repeat protein
MAKASGRNQGRVWEMGATAALLLAVAVTVGGFFAWRERQRRLDAELATLLLPASETDHSRIIVLLRQGASVDTKRENGWTVLMEAASANHLPLLEEAVNHGADVNERTPDGFTPLMMATASGHV